jgi:thiazole/oxazole-forming peptide maturase SagD family component
MSHKHYINKTVDSLKYVISAKESIENETNKGLSPFKETKLGTKINKAIKKGIISIAEKITGDVLYSENNLNELAAIEPKIRSLLTKLIKKGIVKTWTVDIVTQIQSYIVGITIEINDFLKEDGGRVSLIGATGCGTGYTINDAFVPALAELLERYSSAMPKKNKVFFGSELELKRKNTISVEDLKFYTKKQQKLHKELLKNVFTNETKLHWVRSIEISSNKNYLIPAQLVYYFISSIHKDEPFFCPTNSNGVASHTNKTEATVRALLEIFERDAFFLYWLTKRKPSVIKKTTISSEEIQNLIKNIEQQNFKLKILSIVTEFGIPVIISIIYGSTNRNFVSVGASCDFDIDTATRKSLFEAARVAQFFPTPTDTEIKNSCFKYPLFTNFKERYTWWTLSESKGKIDHFISGEEIDYNNITLPLLGEDITNPEKKYTYIKNKLIENKIKAYVVDITSKEARESGLYVKRAVVPELIHLYFKEYAAPLNLKRLSGKELQNTPHPFL